MIETKTLCVLAIALLVTACEPASTWDSKRGRFVSTKEYKQEQQQEMDDLRRRMDRFEQERKQ